MKGKLANNVVVKNIGESSALSIARQLKDLRLAQNITQKEMARRIGISERAYQTFEQSGEVRLMKFLEILRALGMLGNFSNFMKSLSVPQTAEESEMMFKRRERARKK